MRLSLNMLFVFITSVLFSCKDDMSDATPIGLITTEPYFSNFKPYSYHHISTDVENEDKQEITSMGYVYSYSNDHPDLETAEVMDLGPLKPISDRVYDMGVQFSGEFRNLPESNTTYYVKAFAKTPEQVYYGNTVSFKSLRGNWKKVADFPGPHRRRIISFVANQNAYIIGGESLEGEEYNDVWIYDSEADQWTEKKPFYLQTISTNNGSAFVIDDVVYILCSYDMFKYNQIEDSWVRIGDGISYVRNFMTFALNGKGYAVNCYNGAFFEFDPNTELWTNKDNYPGESYKGVALANDTHGYVGFGFEINSDSYVNELYKYDPTKDVWQRSYSFLELGASRIGLASFTAKDKLYVGLGQSETNFDRATLYEFNPLSEGWIEVSSLPGAARSFGTSFSVDDKGYIGMGMTFHVEGQIDKLKDFWQYTPE